MNNDFQPKVIKYFIYSYIIHFFNRFNSTGRKYSLFFFFPFDYTEVPSLTMTPRGVEMCNSKNNNNGNVKNLKIT